MRADARVFTTHYHLFTTHFIDPDEGKAFAGSGRTLRVRLVMSIVNENDQADRAISTGKLHALPHFHTRPINVVVFHGSDREYSFSGGFPA